MSVTGVSAPVEVTASPGQPVVGAHVLGVPATVTVTPGVGTGQRTDPGDQHNQPIAISGASGTVNLSFNASVQPGEPDVASGGEAKTMWLRYQAPDAPGTFTVTVDTAHYVEVFAAPTEDAAVSELEPVDVQSGAAPDYSSDDPPEFPPTYTVTGDTLTLHLAAGDRPLLRTYPAPGAATPWAFTWSFTERVPELVVTVDGALVETPGQLDVTVTNVEPSQTVTFSLPDDPEFYAEDADLSGVLALTVPIDVPLLAGTHTLTAATTTSTGTAAFTVEQDPAVRPTPPPPIPEPTPAPEVTKWYVEDAAGTRTLFEYNPTETTTAYAPQQLSLRTTTSPGGQALTWEGALRAQEWSFSGYLDTQAAYEHLRSLVASEKRWWLVDHRRQYRLVSFETFEPTYQRSVVNGVLNDWSFRYTVTVLIYRHLLEVGP